MLNNKKTYLVGIFGAVLNALIIFGYITLTVEQIIAIEGIITALLGVALRIGIESTK